jgi:hydroxymethylpyrimidine pyrophosphatase-like HAD family hydrolase
MRYLVLATDYDGTIAARGRVAESTLAGLEKVRASGRKLILATGRHLPDLKNIFPQLDRFHRVVAENGALLYCPEDKEEVLLCEPPPASLISVLKSRGVPLDVGRGVIATWEPHQSTVVDAIRGLGLDSQVIFNKGAVMVLPSGVNKASGLAAALKSLRLSAHNVVGIGDAENDHAFIALCECGVAVANSVPALKERADVVTKKEDGTGVEELIEHLLGDDLARYDAFLGRHSISLGRAIENDEELRVTPYRHSILVTGASASGKSTVVAGILEQFSEQNYQFCLVDPEGDYENFAGALSFGTAKERPDINAIVNALQSPDHSIVVNLLDLPVAERPEYFSTLLPRMVELRTQTGRPHWIVIDEAHHLIPTSWSPATSTMAQALAGTILVTVHPEHVSSAALEPVDVIIAMGRSAMDSLRGFAQVLRIEPPAIKQGRLEKLAKSPLGRSGFVPDSAGQALIWFRNESRTAVLAKTQPAKGERRRHRRQYAEGELSAEQSFYFRGPEGKLKLKAQNLVTFLQLAEGVDDDTWNHHLHRSDYSEWFQQHIKDLDLAQAIKEVEQNPRLSAAESKRQIREAVQSRYTVPA